MQTHKSIKHVFLICLFFGLSVAKGLYSQDSIPEVKNFNNSIKIITVFTPIPFIFSISGGYERFIKRAHAVELTGSYFFNKDEMGSTTEIFSLYPGYNYYFRAVKNKGPYFRVGSYLKYVQKYPDDWGNSGQRYGAGLIAGLRLDISKNHKFMFDFACGASADYVVNKHEYFLDENYAEWMPSLRPQLHFTIRF